MSDIQSSYELKIGERIKLIRENKGMDISEVAEKTNLSRPLLNQIESDLISPPLSTLLKIANCLGVDLGILLGGEKKDIKIAVVRKEERIHSPRRKLKGSNVSLGYSYESLAHKKSNKHMEPFFDHL